MSPLPIKYYIITLEIISILFEIFMFAFLKQQMFLLIQREDVLSVKKHVIFRGKNPSCDRYNQMS